MLSHFPRDENEAPYVNALVSKESLILYPIPLKSGHARAMPVVRWSVPDMHELITLMTSNELNNPKEPIKADFMTKVTNTLLFGYYVKMISHANNRFSDNISYHPLDIIETQLKKSKPNSIVINFGSN